MTLRQRFLERPIAHRGLHDAGAGRPENGLSAIQVAVDAGYGVEIDLQLSADGVEVIEAPVEWGGYELTLSSTDGGYTLSSQMFYAGWYSASGGAEPVSHSYQDGVLRGAGGSE